MVDNELLDFVTKDDSTMLAEKQLEAANKQIELLERMAVSLVEKPADWNTVLKLDLNTTHDSYEIWRQVEGEPIVDSMTILPQSVDYEYEIHPGSRIPIEAGLIMEMGNHMPEVLRITNTETIDDVMIIVLQGTKP